MEFNSPSYSPSSLCDRDHSTYGSANQRMGDIAQGPPFHFFVNFILGRIQYSSNRQVIPQHLSNPSHQFLSHVTAIRQIPINPSALIPTFVMPRAPKSKQTTTEISTPAMTRGRAMASPSVISVAPANPHRKNSNRWYTWETVNNPITPSSLPTQLDSTVQELRNISTRLRALDDYATDKWDTLDGLLDDKIEILAAAIANQLKPLLESNTSSSNGIQTPVVVPTVLPVLPTANLNGNSPPNVSSLWNWVDQSVLETILALQFDVTNLYKLTAPEDVTLFNLNLEMTHHGGILINPDGTLTAITSTSKLDKSLPSYAHWTSAFSVYASVRASYDPTGTLGPALIMFMREVNHLQLNFPWPKVLRYFFEFFRDRQDKPASHWLEPHLKAHTKFLHHNDAPVLTLGPNGDRVRKSSPSKTSATHTSAHGEPPKKRYTAEEKALQICQAYNLADKKCQPNCPWGRRHVCLISGCGKPHPQFEHK